MRYALFLAASAAALFLSAACAPQQVGTTAPASANPAPGSPGSPSETDTAARPAWLRARIAAVLAGRKRNPSTHIFRYQYGGQTVYYISAPCCDQFSEVLDAKGQLVCNPDGGITGKGDGKCPDFDQAKTNEKLVWQDPR